MVIPWTLISKVALGVIGFFVRRQERQTKLKRQMLEFIKEHDKSVVENVKLRKEYDQLLRRAKIEELAASKAAREVEKVKKDGPS